MRGPPVSELMVLGFENEAAADDFGLRLAQMQQPRPEPRRRAG